LIAVTSSAVMRRFLFGTAKFAVRWNTYRRPAPAAISGAIWMPVDPVPMRPTRLPVKSAPSRGHRLVWNHSPRKVSSPGIAGTCWADRQPVAITQNRAVRLSPSSVSTVHSRRPAPHTHAVTRVFSWMYGHSWYLSATWFRYLSTSGWAGYRSLHVHSCSSAGSNEYE
jgi:hypothetical protein